MQLIIFAVPALLLAGSAVAQDGGRTNPLDPQAKVPQVEFRSAFEGYRPFADDERREWRRANEEVGAAGDHKGHGPGQAADQSSKTQPGKPDSSGGAAEQGQGAPSHQGHHK